MQYMLKLRFCDHEQNNSLSREPVNKDYWLGLFPVNLFLLKFIRAECMCQRNEVAIILGIIFSLSLSSSSSLLWADLGSDWLMTSKASLLIGCWELTEILVQAKCKHIPD